VLEVKHVDDLYSLLARFEGRRIDFKEEVSTNLYRLLSAFANTAGGIAVIGIRDHDHAVVGVDLRNNAVKKLADSITTRLGIHPVIEICVIEGKSVITVAVERSRVPVACDGRYYTRIGDTTREMLPDELRGFFQQSIEWDSVVGPYSFDEIDEETVRRFFAGAKAAGRLAAVDPAEPVEAFLRRLGLAGDGGISNGAIVLFGREPQRYFQNCILRIGRFKRADIIVGDHEIGGNLFHQFEEGERIIKQYLGVRYDISEEAMRESFQRREVWDYPLPAIREALLNALIHRDYFNNTVQTQVKIFDDHIRFHNPGHLPEGVTIDMILKEHYPYHRNPKVAETFYRAGLVERYGPQGRSVSTEGASRYGSGIERIITAFRSAGMPVPTFASSPLGFTLTMRMDMLNESSLRKMELNERQILAVERVKVEGSITSGAYQSLTGVSATTAFRDLKALVDRGILEQVSPSRRNTRYVLRERAS
jgi:ATP-dependent DNA helicase RecG